MAVTDEQSLSGDLGFDIGVGADHQAVSGSRRRTRTHERRRLPVWAVVAAALLVGWLLGTLFGSSSAATTEVFDPRVALGERELSPTLPTGVLRGTNQSAAREGLGEGKLVFGPAPTEGRGAILSMLDQEGTSSFWLGSAVPSDPTPWIGERSLAVNDTVFLISGGEVFALDTQQGVTKGRGIAPADGLLPGHGAGTGNLWAIDVEPQLVRLIDVASSQVRATYDISVAGLPLASYSGGLVVAPQIDGFGPFALWNPARGIERIWAVDEDAVFVGAAESTIVLQTSQGVASYDTVTGSMFQSDRQLSDAQLASANVSPDGRALAFQGQAAVDDPESVVVVELPSGTVQDEFPTGDVDKMQWVSSTEIVHLGADDDLQVQLRDTSSGFDTSITQLDAPIEWMTLVD